MKIETLHLELLHACPLKCRACDHRLMGGVRLSLKKLGPVFGSAAFKDLRTVSFSGGEPALHPELCGILKAAALAFPAARLILLSSLHCGARLEKTLKALPPPILARLHIGSSLDGPGPVHDAMRGRAGAYARLKAAHARIKNNFPQITTGFTFTATAANAAHFYNAWLAARRELGAPLGVQFLVPNPNTAGLKLCAAGRKKLAEGLLQAVSDCLASGQAGLASGLLAALRFLRHKKTARSCGAGRSFVMLSPEGSFYLCPFHKEITGPLSGLSTLRPALKGAALKTCAACSLRCAQ